MDLAADEKSGAELSEPEGKNHGHEDSAVEEFWTFREHIYAAGGGLNESLEPVLQVAPPLPSLLPEASDRQKPHGVLELGDRKSSTNNLPPLPPVYNRSPPNPLNRGFTNRLLGRLFSAEQQQNDSSSHSFDGAANADGNGSKQTVTVDIQRNDDDMGKGNVESTNKVQNATFTSDINAAANSDINGTANDSTGSVLHRYTSNMAASFIRRGSQRSELSETVRRELTKSKTRVNVTEEVVSNAKAVFSKNRFAKWTRSELIELLISEGIELRGEREYAFTTLRKICDQHFEGQPMPEKPIPWTPDELHIMEKAVRFLQNKWIDYQFDLRNSHNAWDVDDVANDDEPADGDDDWEELEHFEEGEEDDDEEHNLAIALERSLLDQQQQPEQIRRRASSVGIGVDSSAIIDLEQGGLTTSSLPEPRRGSHGPSSSGTMSKRPGTMVKQKTTLKSRVRSELEMDMLARTFSAIDMDAAKRGLTFLDIPWQPPNWEKASIYEKYVKPRQGGKGGLEYNLIETTTGRHCFLYGCGEQCDLFDEGQISQFSLYGPGITNFYKFIKWLAWSFAILSAISFPPLLLNIYGPNISNMGLANIAKTTVGNLANSVQNGTVSVHFPGCNNYGYSTVNCDFDRAMLAKFYSWLEIGAMIFMCISFVWLRLFEKWENKAIDRNVISASMFSVVATNLPDDCTEAELKQHFLQIIPKKYNTSISAVQFAYNNEQEIHLFKRRGKLFKKKARLVNEHRYEVTKIRKASGHEDARDAVFLAREEFVRRCNIIEYKVREVHEKIDKIASVRKERSDVGGKPLMAFITFESALGALSAVNLYNLSLFDRIYMDESKLFKGAKLKVSFAPEPSIIIWENLSYGFWSRVSRRCLSAVLALLLICVAVTVTFTAKLLQETAQSAAGTGLCPSGFDSLPQSEKITLVENDSSILHCYCDGLGIVQQGSSHVCKSYVQKKIQAQVLTYFASAVVLIINLLLGRVIAKFADFEKHHTIDQRNKSIVTGLFILKYINTGAVFLIQNNSAVLRALLGMQRSTTVSLSANWYETIGVTIVLIQLGDLFASQSPNMYSVFVYYYRLYRARKDEKRTLTQAELQELHVGPEMDISFKYAQLLSTVFTCMTYSTGMPVLNFIACLNFLVFYFVEKFMFIRVYQTPRRYNSDLGRQASNFIPVAMLIHIGMAIWTLSNTEMFYTSEADLHTSTLQMISNKFGSQIVYANVTRQHTYTLFLFFVGIFFIAAVVNFSRTCRRYFNAFSAWLHGDTIYKERLKKDFEEYREFGEAILYSRAVRRNLIKGVSNYNPLENPDYKDSFGISWKFAMNNHNMRSVRMFNDLTDADDVDAVKIELARRKRYDARVTDLTRRRGIAASIHNSRHTSTAANNKNKRGGGGSQSTTQKHKKASFRRRIELLNQDTENDDFAGMEGEVEEEDVETGGGGGGGGRAQHDTQQPYSTQSFNKVPRRSL